MKPSIDVPTIRRIIHEASSLTTTAAAAAIASPLFAFSRRRTTIMMMMMSSSSSLSSQRIVSLLLSPSGHAGTTNLLICHHQYQKHQQHQLPPEPPFGSDGLVFGTLSIVLGALLTMLGSSSFSSFFWANHGDDSVDHHSNILFSSSGGAKDDDTNSTSCSSTNNITTTDTVVRRRRRNRSGILYHSSYCLLEEEEAATTASTAVLEPTHQSPNDTIGRTSVTMTDRGEDGFILPSWPTLKSLDNLNNNTPSTTSISNTTSTTTSSTSTNRPSIRAGDTTNNSNKDNNHVSPSLLVNDTLSSSSPPWISSAHLLPSTTTRISNAASTHIQDQPIYLNPSSSSASSEAATTTTTTTTAITGTSISNNTAEELQNCYPNLRRHGNHHTNILVKYLTPPLYHQLLSIQTKHGITIEHLIQGGLCLPYGVRPTYGLGGIFCGDAESYHIFEAFLYPIIYEHHLLSKNTNSNHPSNPNDNNYSNRDQGPSSSTSSSSTPQRHHPKLQRHRTNLDYHRLLQQPLDPHGEYILFTRMRLARSIAGYRFPSCMNRYERKHIEQLVQNCIQDWPSSRSRGQYMSIMDMTNSQHDSLIERQILFDDPDPFLLASGFGRDWPDARGIYVDNGQALLSTHHSTTTEMPHVMIWCNYLDHVWIISHEKGGNVQSVFTRLSKTVWALETSLQQRQHSFCYDSQLGFLNSSVTDIGTGLRASVFCKLVRLGQLPGFHELLQKLRLEARMVVQGRGGITTFVMAPTSTTPSTTSDTTRPSKMSKNNTTITRKVSTPSSSSSSSSTTPLNNYSGIFDIANAESLGKTEVELINTMIYGVGCLIEIEKRLENGETIDLQQIHIEPYKSPNA